MIEIAGGIDVFAKPGDHSARLTWDQIRETDPDILVVMPCGYDEAGAAAQLALLDRPDLRGRMFPVDANGCFSRPGPRLVDGIERLADLFHG
jgi:iron complex transport system substrate-binding protein